MEQYFSIRDLSVISGVKAHTIRVWEKRYNLLQPERTGSNIRQYSNQQLRKLINVTTLLDAGLKISRIAEMQPDELDQFAERVVENDSVSDSCLLHIQELVLSMQQMEEYRFEKVFSSCVLRYGLKETFIDIIYPFLKKVGIMWCCDKILPAHEHFISSLIKQKLFTATDGRFTTKEGGQTWLLALPQGEHHELGLLLAHFIIKSQSHRSIYLGADVPYVNLKPSADMTKATHILLFLIKKSDKEAMHTYLNQLQEDFKNTNILVASSTSGIEAERFPGIHFLHKIDELEKHLYQ